MTTTANDGLAIATFGIVEFTAGSVGPAAPTITAVQLTTTSIRVTVDSDAGTTNTLLYRAVSDSAWTTGNNRVGDGDIDITGLATGTRYYIIVYSDNANSLSVASNMVAVTLTDSDILIEKGLFAYLSNESTITAIVSTRIFPLIVPQDQSYSAITYDRTSGDPEMTNDGESGLIEANFVLNCWATTYAGAKALSEALRLVLGGFGKSTMGAVTVNRSAMTDDSDVTPEYEGNTSRIKAFGVAFDLQIWYQQTPASP